MGGKTTKMRWINVEASEEIHTCDTNHILWNVIGHGIWFKRYSGIWDIWYHLQTIGSQYTNMNILHQMC